MNLLLFLRIQFCLRFDTNKWLWDLEGLIWNSTCLAVKTVGWNNCFSAATEMAEEKSVIIFISLPPGDVLRSSNSSMSPSEKNESLATKKNSFSLQQHRSFILLSLLHHMSSITRVCWNRGRPEFRSHVGRSNTTTHLSKCGRGQLFFFTESRKHFQSSDRCH